MKNLNNQEIWRIAKKIRIKSISNLSLTSSACYKFGFDTNEYPELTKELEKILQVNSSLIVSTNVTDETLENAAKVFIYLSFCPGPELLSWKQFFQNMFQNFQSKMMLLNLNRILKNSEGSIKKITLSIMDKLISILNNKQL